MPFLVYSSVSSASSTRRPLIRSSTRRAFCGETRTYISLAENSMSFPYLAGAGLAAVSVAAFTEWPLKVRVGLNSPSLWPTMFSVTYTGMNFLPLWTASVCPTNSGRMVERRDHVRTTFFSFLSATFLARWSSVNGPFLSDLLMLLLHLPAHDPLVGSFVIARLETSGRLAPGRDGMASAGSFSFAAAVRMVDRIHRHAAIVRASSEPAGFSRLAVRFIFVLDVADLADGGHAVGLHAAHFAGGEFQQRDVALARNKLGLRARRASHLRAFSGTQLDVVNHRSGGDVFQRQRVADQDVGFRARGHCAAHLQSNRADDVALLAVGVVEERDASRAVGVVLDGRDFGRDTGFVALEIDHAVGFLRSTAAETRRNQALAITSARALLAAHERFLGSLLGDLLARDDAHEPARRRGRFVLLHRHD